MNDEGDRRQAGVTVDHTDGFACTVQQHVDSGALVDDASGERGETEVGAAVVA